jgi:hypothetical protein
MAISHAFHPKVEAIGMACYALTADTTGGAVSQAAELITPVWRRAIPGHWEASSLGRREFPSINLYEGILMMFHWSKFSN